ncbi:ribosomal protein S10 [Mycoplasma haemofelis str. Langford 1]|uniref:Small ribosomal subunit protein uS10 n=3 Tax=Mycoplasma TaxID=2093 RepID=H6N8G7_MYCHN|nr:MULTISPECIES: 30S ribosomal protein S10 [Mycoplasma]AEG73766.1 30S ribosomal protein S10 [Mycoplasma haemofelis Ohio2]AEW45939.1 30S ribosomal protein S10 [Mycoplasma haemocanis str. Illinois]CBY93471.1 ribosomal protein S10 [Mycoplasma haemofelis str. Langford 1]
MFSNEIRVKLFSFDYRLLDLWVKKIVELALLHKSQVKGPLPLPTKRKLYTFQKSPHVNKPSMEQFERREHRRLIIFIAPPAELVVDVQKMTLPASLDISVDIR